MKGFFPWFLNKHNIQSYKLKLSDVYFTCVCSKARKASKAKQSKASNARPHDFMHACMHTCVAYMHAAGHPGGGFVKKGGEVEGV